MRTITAVGAALAGLLLMAGPGVADTGVGISASPVVLAEAATAGRSHSAGAVVLANTGTEPGTFTLRIEPEPGVTTRAVPSAWVRFEHARVDLAPGERRAVAVTIDVPAGAGTGDYQSLIYAAAAPANGPAGSRVGAEAATRLMFEVQPGPERRLSMTHPAVLAAAVLAAFGFVRLLNHRKEVQP